jgi:hypothetical protein
MFLEEFVLRKLKWALLILLPILLIQFYEGMTSYVGANSCADFDGHVYVGFKSEVTYASELTATTIASQSPNHTLTSVPPVAEWEKPYTEGEAVFQVIQTNDGGYAFIGTGWAHISYNPPRLFKVDSSGNLQWSRNIEGSSLVQTSDGGYAIAGSDYGNAKLFKIDSTGISQWNQTYIDGKLDVGGPRDQLPMVPTNDAGVVIAANSGTGFVYYAGGSNTANFFVSVLIKIDSSGRMPWYRTYNITGRDVLSLELRSVIQTQDGGYALAGSATMSSDYNTNFCIVKIGPKGDLQWTKNFGGSENDDANSAVQTSDGGYVLAGTTRSFGTGRLSAWLVKIDALGNLEWNRTYGGGSDWFHANSVIQTSDGGLAFAGSKPASLGGGTEFWLVKTDMYGNIEWDQVYDQNWVGYYSDTNSLIEAKDGSLVIAGFRTLEISARGDYFLIKTEPFLPPPTPSETLVPTLPSSLSTPLNALLSTLIVIVVIVVFVILAVALIVYGIKRKQAKNAPPAQSLNSQNAQHFCFK